MYRLTITLIVSLALTACGVFDDDDDDNPPANLAPLANAGADQTVVEGTATTLNASGSSDTDGTVTTFAWTQTAGPNAALTSATTAMPTFSAPMVAADTTLTFQVTVTDDDGATSTDTVNVAVTNVPNVNPVANAGTDQTVAENTAVTLNGAMSADPDGMIATFAWVQSAGPMVTLTGADMAMPTLTTPMVAANTTLTFTLTVTDDMGATQTDTVDVVVTNVTMNVTITGKVTYDHVKHNVATSGLDFTTTTQDPVRGATVQALDGANMVLATTRTDNVGDYSLAVAPNTPVRIRTRAEIIQVGPPSWDVRLVDNTSADAAYVLDGGLTDSGVVNSTRNLNAGSGWDNGTMSYTAARSAAPFAILASIYEAVTKTAAADATVVFPPLLTKWSVNNRPATCAGGNAAGCIGTSSYDGTFIHILGATNTDTDEFDGHVIVHEWGHYFEAQLSRSDSVGGAHGGGDVLDIRVAFGEGFGNALSAIITSDPSYRDSSGANDALGAETNMETNNAEGWFSETTVQSILFDLFDATADGAADTLALGWGPLYNTFINNAYKTTPARTSVHSYLHQLKADNPGSAAAITTLAAASNVNATDEYGNGEMFLPPGTINAGDIIPVYTNIDPTGVTVQVCSINQHTTYNRLSNRRFLRLNIATAANYMIQANGLGGIDADMLIYKNATTIASIDNTGNANTTQALTPGVHIIEVYDFCNIQPGMGGCPAGGNTRSCIDVTVTQM